MLPQYNERRWGSNSSVICIALIFGAPVIEPSDYQLGDIAIVVDARASGGICLYNYTTRENIKTLYKIYHMHFNDRN